MQNRARSKRTRRAKRGKTVVASEAGFSIRQMRDQYIVQVRREGIRESKTFTTLEAARLYCRQLDTTRTNQGLAGFRLDSKQRDDASTALEMLEGRASLVEAARVWLRLNPAAGALTVEQLFERHVEDIRKRNRRKKTVLVRAQFLKRFAKDYGARAASSITADDVRQWLELRVREKTFNTARACLNAAYSFGVKQRLVEWSPVAAIAPKQFEHSEPHFWSVETVAKIMHAAALRDLANDRAPLVPCLALSAFAGLRPTEAERLDWSNVNLEEALIRIPASVSKVRRARLVPMPENLVRWLLPYRKASGPISPSPVTIKRGRKEAMEQAGIRQWPQDVLRHSMATHWMAAHAHEGKLAEMLGNSPAIIQRHYKGLATAKEGAKYFKITPPDAGQIIQIGQAAA